MTKETANILWKQIAVSTKMALGVRDCGFGAKGLSFKCLRNRYIRINLNGNDLYDIEFLRIKYPRGGCSLSELVVISEYTDIYAENLNTVLYDITHE